MLDSSKDNLKLEAMKRLIGVRVQYTHYITSFTAIFLRPSVLRDAVISQSTLGFWVLCFTKLWSPISAHQAEVVL